MPTNDRKINVVVTRPALQALSLCHKLSAANLNPVSYPTIEIQSVSNPSHASQQLANISHKDYLIFTSQNAVTHADLLLNKHWPPLPNTLVAIGPKTANALKSIHLKPTIIAQKPFNSESLLKQFQHTLEGKTAAIIKGEGGRPFLAKQLQKRGLSLINIDVYQRCTPRHSTTLNSSFKYITVTSQLALDNFFSLQSSRVELFKQQVHFIAFSQRIANYALTLGCQHVYTCAEASDDSLVDTILSIEKANEF